ncbi:unnamed protein product, partial [Discosporangium mesarthrocarpum]
MCCAKHAAVAFLLPCVLGLCRFPLPGVCLAVLVSFFRFFFFSFLDLSVHHTPGPQIRMRVARAQNCHFFFFVPWLIFFLFFWASSVFLCVCLWGFVMYVPRL